MKSITKSKMGIALDKDTTLSAGVKVTILLLVLSIVFVFVGTILLLNTYTPKVKAYTNTGKLHSQATDAIVVPSQLDPASLVKLNQQLSTYTNSLTADEQHFEESIK